MNNAKLDKSKRLQKVMAVISDGDYHTTQEIMQRTKCCTVSTVISELRRNGKVINTRCHGHGDNRYFDYQLEVD